MFGFVRVAAARPKMKVADCIYNTERIIEQMSLADSQGVEIVCFPELTITGATCGDLFRQQILLDAAENSLLQIIDFSRNLKVISIVGIPVVFGGHLYDCAAVVKSGKLHGLVVKSHCQKRIFTSGRHIAPHARLNFCGCEVPIGMELLFDAGNFIFGAEIAEDLWAPDQPSTHMALKGADIIFNLNASPEIIGKTEYQRQLVEQQSGRCLTGYVYCSSGYGESTMDDVFSGRCYIADHGHIIASGERFSFREQLLVSEIDVEYLRHDRQQYHYYDERRTMDVIVLEPSDIKNQKLVRKIENMPFVPHIDSFEKRCEEILFIQSQALATRIKHVNGENVVVGVSGGLDSTLALLVCVHAFDRLGLDRKGIIGVTLPGFGTSDRTYKNAQKLMDCLKITSREISIKDAVIQHFKDISHDIDKHDVTYENSQARERTQILMDVANQCNALVIGTGDMSELALGWATYNGDHMSMYGLNASVPKTLVKYLVKWVATHVADGETREILLDIVDTPISPELIPTAADGSIQQKTEDLVGPYDLHDFYLYHLVRYGARPSKIFWLAQQAFAGIYDDETIKKWLKVFCRRFFTQQFKRSCLPDGPRVGTCSLSPRGAWCMPSDAAATLWMNECENL